jgi:hypothetical protein
MGITRSSGHGRRSGWALLTAGGAILMLCSACSPASSGPPGVQQACSDYGTKARPLIETVFAMDAKIRSGDTEGATADANTIVSTLGGVAQQPALTANEASTQQLQLVIQGYSIWGLEWSWAQAQLAGTISEADIDGFEANLIAQASLADQYAIGKSGSAAVCPDLSIPSPYHPAVAN